MGQCTFQLSRLSYSSLSSAAIKNIAVTLYKVNVRHSSATNFAIFFWFTNLGRDNRWKDIDYLAPICSAVYAYTCITQGWQSGGTA